MAVLKVRKYGDPALRRNATPVGEVTPEVRAIIADMTETMYDEVGIGLAAPQVGISRRLPFHRRVRPVGAESHQAKEKKGGSPGGRSPPRLRALKFSA